MQGADRFRVFFRKSSQIVYEKQIVTNGHVLYNKDREIGRQAAAEAAADGRSCETMHNEYQHDQRR